MVGLLAGPVIEIPVPALVPSTPVLLMALPTIEIPVPAVRFCDPGKVWPEAKVMTPLLAIDRPVAAGAHVALLLQNMRLSEGVVVAWNPKVFVADAPVD